MACQRISIPLALLLLVTTLKPALAQVSLMSFSVRLEGDTAQLALTLSEPVNVSSNGPCFFNNLVFVDNNLLSRQSTPMYGGTCESSSMSTEVVGFLDIRDFASALTIGLFTSSSTSAIISTQGSGSSFLPGVNLIPISTAVQPSAFTPYRERATLDGFDVDLTSNLLLLNFSDIMSLTGFRSTSFTLLSGLSGINSLTLSTGSRPRTSANNIKVVCVELSASDVAALASRSICTSADRCYASYTFDLGINYAGQNVVPSVTNMQVTNLFPRLPSVAPRLYMVLSLSYIDCSVTRLLASDEVYLVRRGEQLNRVFCYATGGSTWPELTFGESNNMQIPQGLSRTQYSGNTSLSAANEFSSEMFGLYTCTAGDDEIQHYIVNGASSFLGLPNGPEYSTMLYDSLTIPFFFGSLPKVNLTESTVEINLMQLSGSAQAEPQYRKLSAYKGQIYYSRAPYSVATEYILTVIATGIQNPTTTLSISITAPDIVTIPAVVTLLPSDTSFTLQCIAMNPSLQQFLYWIPGNAARTSVTNPTSSLTVQVSSRAPFYVCALQDPEDNTRIALETIVPVRQILEPISVYNDGNFVNDTAEFEVRNQFAGDLSLQCIGNIGLNVTDVVWVSQKTGESPVVLRPAGNNNQIQVTYSYNEANITLVNSVEPYRGTLRCQSSHSGRQATFYIVETRTPGNTTEGCLTDIDEVWGITWQPTRRSYTGSQPCPQVNGTNTGFAYRECDSNGEWESTVDTSQCESVLFNPLSANVNEFINNFDSMSSEEQIAAIEPLIRSADVTTAPRNISLFPSELRIAVIIVNDLVSLLTRMYTSDQYTNLNLLNAFDNLLDSTNTPGWRNLNELNQSSGGLLLLQSIQIEFRRYLYLIAEDGQTSYFERNNLYINIVKFSSTSYTAVTFPNNSDSRSRDAQITIPTDAFMEFQAEGVVISVIRNIAGFLPSPRSDNTSNTMSLAASNLIYPVFYPDTGATVAFTSEIQSKYLTYRVLRGSNPRCIYWDSNTGSWDTAAIETDSIRKVEIGEFKTFEVDCSSHSSSAQAVLVDTPSSIEAYEVTTAAYVGSGFILFFVTMTMFLYLTSCVCGKDFSYYVSPYLVKLSFCSSIIAAFVVFLAGVSQGLGGNTVRTLTSLISSDSSGSIDEQDVCTVVSVLLHYFFTASFVWLLCETIVILAFKWVSTHSWSFILFFFVGWGLPVIPVVVSVGILTDSYISTSHCWFYFDGEISSEIFLAFLIPKLAIVAMILLLLPVSLMTACTIKKQKMEGETNLPVCLLLFTWLGILIQLLLFCGAWVFLMLHVNNYLETSGWIFAGIAIALAIWLFGTSFFIVLFNQRIDYESFWAVYSGGQTLKRPKKKKEKKDENKGYEEIQLEQDMFSPSEKAGNKQDVEREQQMVPSAPEYEEIGPAVEDNQALVSEELKKTYID